MTRRLLNLLTALSLLLCVAAAALWVRSYWAFDDVQVMPSRGVTYRAAARPGLIVMSRAVLTGRTTDIFSDDFDRGPGWSMQSRPRGAPESPFTAEGSPRVVQRAGFDYLARDESRPGFGTLAFRRTVVPMWLPLVLTAILPARRWWSSVKRHRGRRGAGLCPSCGYDLRATPGRCPECGTPAATLS